MCSSPATKTCRSCRCSRYCSKSCYKDDRPTHKLLCHTFRDFLTPPTPDHYRAIFFSDNEDKPYFVWLKMELISRDDEAATTTIKNCFPSTMLLREANESRRPEAIDRTKDKSAYNPVLKRAHERIEITSFLRPDQNGAMELDGQLNTSMQHIDPELVGAICGPRLYHGVLTHLDTMSFRHIVDELRAEYYDLVIEREESLPGDTQGVRVNCEGDTQISERPAYEALHVNKDEFSSRAHTLDIPVSTKIQIPLQVHKLPPALPWRNRSPAGHPALTYALNVKFLRLNPANWPAQTGSLVVVGQDAKPLHPVHVQTLV